MSDHRAGVQRDAFAELYDRYPYRCCSSLTPSAANRASGLDPRNMSRKTGAGNGIVTQALARALSSAAADCTATDVSQANDRHRADQIRHDERVVWRQGRREMKLPFADGGFDLVVFASSWGSCFSR